jgi:succinoglycan biosynthesis transport protein ExoP
MSNPERELAPWSPSPLVPKPAQAAWDSDTMEMNPPRMFSPKVVLRALRRHWWQILAIWLVGSVGLVYLAATKIRPSYDAISWLSVEPPSRGILLQGNTMADFGPYLDTQVLLITSPDVLAMAIKNPEIANLPKITKSNDPEIDLRKEIGVGVPQKNTHVIQVKLSGENSKEVVAIVNAVVKAYLDMARSWTDDASKAQIASLMDMERDNKKTVEQLQIKVRDLAKKAGANDIGNAPADQGKEKDGEAATFGKLQITRDEYRSRSLELSRFKIQRFQAEMTVRFLEEEIKARGGAVGAAAVGGNGTLTEEQIVAQTRQDFAVHPEAIRLGNELEEAQRKYDLAAKRIRSPRDPSLLQVKHSLDNLEKQRVNLWEDMYPRLRRNVMAAANGPAVAPDAAMAERERALSQAKLDLQKVVASERILTNDLKSASVEVLNANAEILDAKFAEAELQREEVNLATVSRHRQELEHEAQVGARIKLIAAARISRSPSGDNRTKVMAAAPVLMLALSCLIFIFLEFRSGRVADPDELSQRIRIGVIGVVPPLPSLNAPTRALSARGQQNEKRRVEEFVQSLDHLRVTICAPRPGQTSDRRCVLITSATGGEGKTTLAAQLAGRCANAGLMTLLIDADLRRPSLGDLLEVPEGPGFIDVLTGEVAPEAAMVVIGNAGGFHLLPAGTLGQDPSRLLHGDRLGKLIAQFRETFDIVIIDAPPVLAVPDALLLGRWTDGAILAVRHDTSRFPLVERANKRLASVGVTVLGAVVNGCRTMESAYGSYRYTPYAAADAPGAALEE